MKQIFIIFFVFGIACTIFGYFGEQNVKSIKKDTESKLLLLSEAESVIWSEAKKEVRSTLMQIHFSPISKKIERSYNSIFIFGILSSIPLGVYSLRKLYLNILRPKK